MKVFIKLDHLYKSLKPFLQVVQVLSDLPDQIPSQNNKSVCSMYLRELPKKKYLNEVQKFTQQDDHLLQLW